MRPLEDGLPRGIFLLGQVAPFFLVVLGATVPGGGVSYPLVAVKAAM